MHANGNPNHRIAVFAEEIDNNDTPATGDLGKCENRKRPVVILKASPKQIIDLQNGQIIGPYQDFDEGSKPPLPVINSNSFINSSSCCLNGISKPKKSCGCCSNKTNKNVNKLKILKTYFEKHIKPENEPKFVDYSKQIKIKNEDRTLEKEDVKPSVVIDNGENGIENPTNNKRNTSYDVVKIPSCSIPGSCGCDSDCACEGCFVHGNVNVQDLNNNQFSNLVNYANKNEIKMPNEIMSNYAAQITEMMNNQRDNTTPDANSNEQMQYEFANTQNNTHTNTHNHNRLDMTSESLSGAPPSTLSDNSIGQMNLLNGQMYNLHTDLPEQENTHRLQIHIQEDEGLTPRNEQSIEHKNVCSCSDECDCFNCETHGIINGTKLDDLFNNALPMDYKDLVNSIGLDRDDIDRSNLGPVSDLLSSDNGATNFIANLNLSYLSGKTSNCCKK